VQTAKTRAHLSVVRAPVWGDASDASLAAAAIEGAAGAAGAVWDRHSTRARAVLRRILGPSVDVEDLLQETFFQAFKDLPKLRERDKLQAFVIGVAVRMARSELRRRRLRRWLLLTESGASPDAPGDEVDADAREAVRRLYALLDRFDDQSRAIFTLRYIEGLELVDVAAALEISLATTKRYLVKVTARVRAGAANDPVLAAYVDRVTPVPEVSDG
jgi:RNA polymerase sigma-70 factor (ECF subfamily)